MGLHLSLRNCLMVEVILYSQCIIGYLLLRFESLLPEGLDNHIMPYERGVIESTAVGEFDCEPEERLHVTIPVGAWASYHVFWFTFGGMAVQVSISHTYGLFMNVMK